MCSRPSLSSLFGLGSVLADIDCAWLPLRRGVADLLLTHRRVILLTAYRSLRAARRIPGEMGWARRAGELGDRAMGCALLGARQERRKAWRRKQKQNRRGSDSSAISHARASVSEGQGRRARTRTWTRTSASFKTSPRSFPPPARLRTRPQLQPRCASARPTPVDDVTTPFPPLLATSLHLGPLQPSRSQLTAIARFARPLRLCTPQLLSDDFAAVASYLPRTHSRCRLPAAPLRRNSLEARSPRRAYTECPAAA